MADYTVKDVKTFVAELPAPTMQEILQTKFQGRKTTKTLAAARRIAKHKRTVKVPRNLLRKLFMITGGWVDEALTTKPIFDYKIYPKFEIGDLTVYANVTQDSWYFTVFLVYRGVYVASIGHYGNPNKGWQNKSGAFNALKGLCLT